MRKIIYTTIVAASLGLTGAALAGPPDGLPGNQGCGVSGVNPDGTLIPAFKNPGKLFQAIKEATGNNPKQHVDQFPDAVPIDTVGDYIDAACDDPNI